MKLFTIGYSGKSEAKFFEILREVGVSKIIDVRRFRTSKFVSFASEINLQKNANTNMLLWNRSLHYSNF